MQRFNSGKSNYLAIAILVVCFQSVLGPAMADEPQTGAGSGGLDMNEMIKSVLKNLKTTPGATPGSVDFSVPGLAHGTVRVPAKDASKSGTASSQSSADQSSADAPVNLDIHFDDDGHAAGLPKGAVPNALDWLMPGKAKGALKKAPVSAGVQTKSTPGVPRGAMLKGVLPPASATENSNSDTIPALVP